MNRKSRPMTAEEFIEFCYRKILGRNPDNKAKMHYTNALSSQDLTREDMLIEFITCKEFESRIASLEFVPAGHFYSAIPDLETREAFASSNRSDDTEVLGVDLNLRRQMDLLKKFKKYHDECPFPEHKTSKFRYYFSNPFYSYTDALTLYSMIRLYKPRTIIEIGSGFSSCAMLDTNDLCFEGEINVTFVEPFPELLLSSLWPSDNRDTIIQRKLQEVDKNTFKGLEANDILFVDSTHVSKLNSDVNRIVFEILPTLRRGVLIHFHDIFWPFEYPKEWVREGRAWNEAYILRAFLEFNEDFEILFFASYLHRFQRKWFQENMPLYLRNTGGNIWLRKKGA
jgi:predicted O-methyltransferase YrrM